jgi:hypothetical protein
MIKSKPIDTKKCKARYHLATILLGITATIPIFSSSALAEQPDYCITPPAAAQNNPYRTNSWGGKFLYGGYSTLFSSHVMGTKHRILIALLNNRVASESEIARRLRDFQNDYCSLTETQAKEILAYAQANRSNSIFQEERSAIFDDSQNKAFINKMPSNKQLMPVDDMIQNGRYISDTFQYNTHRALANPSYGIPQNSLAAIVNAYVAGIRSVEFDVLETENANNVVIHDLTTNRLTGDFNSPPVYVDFNTYPNLEETNIDILNPLASSPSVQSTGVKNMLLTEVVLDFMHKYLPEMTAYIDARNNSPVSVIEIIKRKPELGYHVVTKVYPFTLNGGLNSLVKEYAKRKFMSETDAAREIATVKPNILLAMGSAATQANELASVGHYSNFTWRIFQSDNVVKNLPFSRKSDPTHSFNKFNNQPIFNEPELIQIEAMSYNLSKWAFDFFAATNVMVFQVNINPSLKNIVQTNNGAEFNAMPLGDKMLAAAIDNFITLYASIKGGQQPTITLSLPAGGSQNLQTPIANTVWGFSDRYPDYTFARQLTSGGINQDTIRDFLYSMEGTVYEKNDYSAKKMRSTKAVFDKIAEMEKQGLKARYATTDLPTDLRLGAMGILGTLGLPADLRYRAGALIKPHFLPEDIPTYQRPNWTNRLYGNAAKGREQQFDADVDSLVKYKNTEIPRYQNAITAIATAKADSNVVITNLFALNTLAVGQPVFAQDVSAAQLDHVLSILRTDLSDAQASLNLDLIHFKNTYGTDFIWEPEPPYFPEQP